jgi:hypothetical protein
MRKKIILFYYCLEYLFYSSKDLFTGHWFNNLKKWRKLHNKFKGKRIILIGNGPSLNQTPLYLLKDEFTMAFNRFDLLLERINWNPTFYAVADGVVAQDSQEELNKMIQLAEYSFFPYCTSKHDRIYVKGFIPDQSNVFFMSLIPKFFFKYQFSTCFPFVIGGGTITSVGFQILAYLGFSEILICGVDMNYVIRTNTTVLNQDNHRVESKGDDDPNHFDPRYFGKGRKYHHPIGSIDAMRDRFAKAKQKFDILNIKSINIGYNSKVECFEKKDFYQALDYDNKKIDMLFEDLISKHGYSSYDEFNSKLLCTIAEWNDDEDIQSLPINEAIKIIKNVILTHIPLGPYKDKIYFIKRKEKTDDL